MQAFTFSPGNLPLLISMPHAGTYIPDDIAVDLTPEAHAVPDTDWHLPRVYDFVQETGASCLAATHSRYVIDLNRDPQGVPLYPGASNSELCPTSLFDNAALYLAGREPDSEEIARRRRAVWEPYHRQLDDELERLLRSFVAAMLAFAAGDRR